MKYTSLKIFNFEYCGDSCVSPLETDLLQKITSFGIYHRYFDMDITISKRIDYQELSMAKFLTFSILCQISLNFLSFSPFKMRPYVSQ